MLTMRHKKPDRRELSKEETELNVFQAFINNSPDFALLSRIDDFRFVVVNELACTGYGYTKKQFLALRVFDIEAAPRKQKEIRGFYDTTPVGEVITFQATNKRKDGSQTRT